MGRTRAQLYAHRLRFSKAGLKSHGVEGGDPWRSRSGRGTDCGTGLRVVIVRTVLSKVFHFGFQTSVTQRHLAASEQSSEVLTPGSPIVRARCADHPCGICRFCLRVYHRSSEGEQGTG